jgi:hypothetical protein
MMHLYCDDDVLNEYEVKAGGELRKPIAVIKPAIEPQKIKKIRTVSELDKVSNGQLFRYRGKLYKLIERL